MLTALSYQLNTAHFSWDAAHVYEHAVLIGAKKYLRAQGVNVDMYGWMAGQTFEHRLFIDVVTYHPSTAEYLDRYMRERRSDVMNTLDEAIASVEAESKSNFVGDKQVLIGTFKMMNQLQWGQDAHVPANSDPIKLFQAAAKEFRDVTVEFSFTDLETDEQKFLLRLRPIFFDIVMNYLVHKIHLYERATSPVAKSDDSTDMSFSTIFTTRRGSLDLRQRPNDILSHVRHYPITKTWSDIQCHFDTFAHEPLWKDSCVEYYRHTGIATTPGEICDLATISRMQKIISKLQLNLHATTKADWERVET